jgi:hypothetical protein
LAGAIARIYRIGLDRVSPVQKDGPPGLCLVGRIQLRALVLLPPDGLWALGTNNSRHASGVSRRNVSFRRNPVATREANADHEHH